MPKFRRLVLPGYPHHVTQRGVRRQQTFFCDDDYRAYLRIADSLLIDADLSILGYCLMPNHIHMIVVPETKSCLSGFLGNLHRRYARDINEKNEWKGHLWQQRFYSVVMDEQHTAAALRYVEQNPVRAGLVRRPSDWKWSSARYNLGLVRDSIADRTASQSFVSNWSDLHELDPDEEQIERIRNQTRTGRPAGEPAFLDRVEALSGRVVRKMKTGPKQLR